MEYFMLLATDAEDVHEVRMAARPAHLARLEELKAQGTCSLQGATRRAHEPHHDTLSARRPILLSSHWCPSRPASLRTSKASHPHARTRPQYLQLQTSCLETTVQNASTTDLVSEGCSQRGLSETQPIMCWRQTLFRITLAGAPLVG